MPRDRARLHLGVALHPGVSRCALSDGGGCAADPFERAKHDELYQILELYLELQTRRLLPAFFGGRKVHDSIAVDVKETVLKGMAALDRLARFDRFLTGSELRAVDIAATMHLPAVAVLSERVLGENVLGALPAAAAFQQRMEQRPHVQRIRREATLDGPRFMAHLKALYGWSAEPLETTSTVVLAAPEREG